MYAYIDDLLVVSLTMDEHLQQLRQLFMRLREYGISINAEKREFGNGSLHFPDHFSRYYIDLSRSRCHQRLSVTRLTKEVTIYFEPDPGPQKWLVRCDSNIQPPDLDSDALPLLHRPTNFVVAASHCLTISNIVEVCLMTVTRLID